MDLGRLGCVGRKGVYTFDSGKEFMLTGVSLSHVFVNLIDSGSV